MSQHKTIIERAFSNGTQTEMIVFNQLYIEVPRDSPQKGYLIVRSLKFIYVFKKSGKWEHQKFAIILRTA